MTQGVRDQPMRGQYPGHVITLHQSEARNDTRGERSVVMNNIWQSPGGGESSGGNIVMKCDEWKNSHCYFKRLQGANNHEVIKKKKTAISISSLGL